MTEPMRRPNDRVMDAEVWYGPVGNKLIFKIKLKQEDAPFPEAYSQGRSGQLRQPA